MALLPTFLRRLGCAVAALGGMAMAGPDAGTMARGEKLYAEKCLICHQATGLGAPPAFPPLAGSEWWAGDRVRLIRVLCEGLSGKIAVKGQSFDNAMPAQMLDDGEVAAVLSFAGNTWGNAAGAFAAEEVAAARRLSRFKTYAELARAAAFQPLPTPPEGWMLRELAQLPECMVRMAGDAAGTHLYLLGQAGNVYSLDASNGGVARIVAGEEYLDGAWGSYVTLGMTVGPDGRLWVTSNQKLTREVPVFTNEVTIWRSTAPAEGRPVRLERWFTHRYPYGFGPFNHGVSHIAFGPDGLLYVSSGARTDGGEVAQDAHFAPVHEVESTACLWRLDPQAARPELEVLARGIRNAYGFAWDGAGRLFTMSNGPDYDAGEEMDCIEPGRHYGFPYQYEDWPVRPHFPYAHTPPPPEGVTFTHPVENVGPDGGFREGRIARTFTPHSSPGGTMWCGEEYAAPLGGSFVVPRFGNLLAKAEDSGFDLLSVRPRQRADGTWEAEVHTVLAPLGRPIDVHGLPGGRVLVLEYTRPTNFKEGLGWLPGRVLELAPAPRP